MEGGSTSHLQGLLRAAVQSVQWTYSVFWRYSHKKRKLVWAEGYYNGAIKTRKTVMSMEGSEEAASLQRSQQLRELYESLSAGEGAHPHRRPCASLSPEDLTETEWFYLMCVSFSFQLGEGLPGRAYSRRQHVWLSEAAESHDKTFERAILAKGAQVETVVCIPLMDGVVEFGYTEKVQEDLGFIQHLKTFFLQDYCLPQPASWENSTSNEQLVAVSNEEEDDNNYEEDEEPSELMQLEMPEDIRLGSPDEMESDSNIIQIPTPPQISSFDVLSTEAKHYSETVAAVLRNMPAEEYKSSSHSSSESLFTKWTSSWKHNQFHRDNTASQWLLKSILFSVPNLHSNHNQEKDISPMLEKNQVAHTGLPASHVLSERRRREKLNEKFVTLRAMIPFVTESDKASILGDTIEYVKQLKDKARDLESSLNQCDTAPSQERESRVDVSIIGGDALIEMQCRNREGLLLDIVQILRGLKVETTAILSSTNEETLVAELKAKVNESGVGKVSIKEVKRAINKIIPDDNFC